MSCSALLGAHTELPVYAYGVYPHVQGGGASNPMATLIYGEGCDAAFTEGSFEADVTDNCPNDGATSGDPAAANMDCDFVSILSPPPDGTQAWRDPQAGAAVSAEWGQKWANNTDPLYIKWGMLIGTESTADVFNSIAWDHPSGSVFGFYPQPDVSESAVGVYCPVLQNAFLSNAYTVGQWCNYKVGIFHSTGDIHLWCDSICGSGCTGMTGSPALICNGFSVGNEPTGFEMQSTSNILASYRYDNFCVYSGADPDA